MLADPKYASTSFSACCTVDSTALTRKPYKVKMILICKYMLVYSAAQLPLKIARLKISTRCTERFKLETRQTNPSLCEVNKIWISPKFLGLGERSKETDSITSTQYYLILAKILLEIHSFCKKYPKDHIAKRSVSNST